MGDLSEHFDKSEMECNCGKCKNQVNISPDLIERLEAIRWRIGRPISITSGVRCPEYNKEVGGKPTSSHLKGLAVDIEIDGSLHRMKFVDEAIDAGVRRMGIGSNFIHVDIDLEKPQDVMWVYS